MKREEEREDKVQICESSNLLVGSTGSQMGIYVQLIERKKQEITQWNNPPLLNNHPTGKAVASVTFYVCFFICHPGLIF